MGKHKNFHGLRIKTASKSGAHSKTEEEKRKRKK